MGGIGKTEMARNFAMSNRGRCHVFWVDCMTQHEMIRDFVAIGPMLVQGKDTFDVAAVQAALSQRDDWLMIIDNVDEEMRLKYIEESILSWPYNGQILVTGRLTMIRRICPAHFIEMGVMSPAEATSFLKLLMAQQDLEGADDLVKLLEFLPLAIEQAALYMMDNHMSTDTYLDRYQNEEMRADLLNYGPKSPFSKPVLKTFDISYDMMSVYSKLVLQLFAFFGLDSVSDEFLQRSALHHPVGNWKGTTDELEDYFNLGISAHLLKQYSHNPLLFWKQKPETKPYAGCSIPFCCRCIHVDTLAACWNQQRQKYIHHRSSIFECFVH